MKNIKLILVIVGGILALSVTTHFSQPKAFAASSCPDSHFPYGFMPNNPGANANTSVSVSGLPGGTSQNSSGTYVLPGGGHTFTVNVSYTPCGPAFAPSGGGIARANVLDWVTIDANVGSGKVLNSPGSVNPSGGGSVIGCPGSSNPGQGLATQQIIYNDQDLQYGPGPTTAFDGEHGSSGPSSSPVAYNNNTGYGVENCNTYGLTAYWQDDGNGSNTGHSLSITTQAVYSTFCVREDVSVQFPGDAGLFFSNPAANITNGNPNSTASHVAQQSTSLCFETHTPPTGTGNHCGTAGNPPCPSAPYQTADCVSTYAFDAGDSGTIQHTGPAGNNSTDNADTSGWNNYGTAAPPAVRFDDGSPGGATSSTWSTSLWDSGYVPTRTIVTVRDTAGNTLVSAVVGTNRGTHGTTGIDNTWYYQPNGETVSYTFEHQEYLLTHLKVKGSPDKDGLFWVTYQTDGGASTPCYTGSCSLQVIPNVPGAPPGSGAVESSSTFTILATITNNGGVNGNTTIPDGLGGYGFSLSGADGPHYIHGLAPGDSEYLTLTANAPASGTPSFSYALDYYLNPYMTRFSPSCTTTIDVFQYFTVTPNAAAELTPYQENPDMVKNSTWITVGGSVPVKECVNDSLYKKPIAGGQIPEGTPPSYSCRSGPFASGVTYLHGPDYLYPTVPPIVAGDQYCAEIDVQYSSGWTNAAYTIYGGSTTDAAGNPNNQSVDCDNIANRPFFKVYNSGVSAGGSFKGIDPTCTGGGELAGWNNNSGVNPDYGASAAYNALALNDIVGVGSHQNVFGNNALDLSFANTVNNSGASGTDGPSYSSKLGGDFDSPTTSRNCLTTLDPKTNTVTVVLPGDHPIPINGGNYRVDGDYTPQKLGSGFSYVKKGQHIVIYVKGNVTINENMLFEGDSGGDFGGGHDKGGANLKWNTTSNIPSFILVATGNIYIAKQVTELDGIYASIPADPTKSANGTAGRIYTCSEQSNPYSTGALVTSANLFNDCKNQLTVYGSFVANQVKLMRTYGTLRDETPIPGAAHPHPATPGATKPLEFYTNKDSAPYGNCVKIHEPYEDGGSHSSFAGLAFPNDFGKGRDYLCARDGSGVGLTPSAPYLHFLCQPPGADPDNCGDGPFFGGAGDTGGCTDFSALDAAGYSNSYGWNNDYICSTIPGISFKISSTDPSLSDTSIYCTSMYDPSVKHGPYIAFPNTIWQQAYVCVSKGSAGSATTYDPGTQHVVNPCSNSAGATKSSPRLTCAAEVFDLSPEMYLTSPGLQPPSNGGVQSDSISSLPPIL
ncbi:MAG TPA: hypothetical protein VLF79_00960 [Candidatus Saccharimonadales bacterium]|nr:hypothetical protein [Candidatus Saccharimonadales bacterium]